MPREKKRRGYVTPLVRAIHNELLRLNDPAIAHLDEPEEPIVCPGLEGDEIPLADISGRLTNGEDFSIEVDDTTEPGANVTKYWPRLDAAAAGEPHAPLRLLTIASRHQTCGSGYMKRARFYGQKLEQLHPGHFHHGMTEFAGKNAGALGAEILGFLKAPWPARAAAALSTSRVTSGVAE